MFQKTERILDGLESGRISRREATARLAGLLLTAVTTGRVLAAEEGGQTTFQATGLNHLALRVTDVKRSKEFYQRHFGLSALSDNGAGSSFLGCGDNFVALFRSSDPGMDHYCYTVEAYDPDRVMKRLKEAGLSTRRAENRVYTADPDGLEVQLAGPRSSWPGSPGE